MKLFGGRIEIIGLRDLLNAIRKPRYHFKVDGVPKLDYQSKESAENAAERMSAKVGQQLEAYCCPMCRGWHIGKSND